MGSNWDHKDIDFVFFCYITFVTYFMQCLSHCLCSNGKYTNAHDVFSPSLPLG